MLNGTTFKQKICDARENNAFFKTLEKSLFCSESHVFQPGVILEDIYENARRGLSIVERPITAFNAVCENLWDAPYRRSHDRHSNRHRFNQ